MRGDASQIVNIKWKHGYVTYRYNNRGKILDVGDIRGEETVTIKDVLLGNGL